MSAYGKPQQPNLHGFDAGQGSFSFSSPVYGSQAPVSSASVAPAYQSSNTLPQMTYPTTQSQSSYDDQGPYLHVGSTGVPKVTSFTPLRASQGTQVYVGITSQYDLQMSSAPSFFLMFGQNRCPASMRKTGQQGAVCSYMVTTETPQFASLHWNSAQVPVSLLIEAGEGDLVAKVDCGHFTYIDGGVQGRDTQQEVSRKRKMSTDSAELMKSPAKRVSSQQMRPKEEYNSYTYSPSDGSHPIQSPYLQSPSSYGNIMPHYTRSSGGYQSQAPPRHLGYNYSTSGIASPPNIKAEAVTTWIPSYGSIGSGLARNPGLLSNAGSSRSALTGLVSPATGGNPPLIRTSTLQQTPSPASTPHGNPAQTFNAYSLYPNKAKLEIIGNLDAMAQHWSEDEWESKRRLVHFRRSQSGSTITTTFQPVSLDERPPNAICVSCILWEEKNLCFVTSVDTIYLLEQLVDARFTVEEKNRIRRNLEGFRPLTVSKGKPESEEFFKVIMAFPTPKPRNIEKDVKVFHWKDLASALKKIFGKYSASPASTLPPLPQLTPVSSNSYVTEGSSAGISYVNDHHGAVSPRSISGSTASSAYTTNVPARVLSPLVQKSMTSLQSGPPDLRVSVPHPHDGSSHWQGGQQQHHMPTSQQYQHLGNQPTRGSWDMSSYLENSPVTAGGTSTQPHNYASGRNVVGTSETGSDNRITSSLQTQQQQQQSHQMPRT